MGWLQYKLDSSKETLEEEEEVDTDTAFATRRVTREAASRHKTRKSNAYDEVGQAFEAPVIRPTATMEVWDVEPSERLRSDGSINVSDIMWQTIQNGKPISEIIRASPGEVITALKDHSVKKLGSFYLKDVEVVLAFGQNQMLTRGFDAARDDDFKTNWEQIIENRVNSNSSRRRYIEDAWEQKVKVTAYVVNIADAAAPQKYGLLHPLVKKSQSGGTKSAIWAFPAVQAVIEYKWVHWARYICLVQLGFYLCWLMTFTLFMLTYTEWNLKEKFEDQSKTGRFVSVNSSLLNVLSVGFMAPSIIMDFNSLYRYRLQFFKLWKIIDSLTYILQIVISYGQLSRMFLDATAYDTLLAIQCVLLYIKVQYFGRLFSRGTSFVELLMRVVMKIRGFLFIIILMMISATLAFTVLYREDRDRNMPGAEDFRNCVRSLVTTYALLLGDFNPSYVFDTTNRIAKGAFFLSFQLIMSITLLNLLIAVVTESYVSTVTDGQVMHNMGKAQAMDEMEISLPGAFRPRMKPFCHFLVVDSGTDIEADEDQQLPELPDEWQLDLADIKAETMGLSLLKDNVGKLTSHIKGLGHLENEISELKSDMKELKSLIKDMRK